MSSVDFANYLHSRMVALNIGPTKAAERSGLTRQAWYKLLNADVEEAKISTLRKLAKALQTTPEHLLHIYFQDERKITAHVPELDSFALSEDVPMQDPACFSRLHKLFEQKDGLSLRG